MVTTKKAVKTAPSLKGRKPVDPNETKEMKLSRLGGRRVNQAVRMIRLIGNLAAYKPTDAQIDKIMVTLGEACAGIEARMRGTRKENTSFQL